MENNSNGNNISPFEKSNENIFFVDTKIGIFKAGVRMKPLILYPNGFFIGKKKYTLVL